MFSRIHAFIRYIRNTNALEVRYMTKVKYIVLLVFILPFIGSDRLRAQSTPLEEKIQSYKWTVLHGDGTEFYRENIWAWLEEMKDGNLDADQTYATDKDGNVKPISEISIRLRPPSSALIFSCFVAGKRSKNRPQQNQAKHGRLPPLPLCIFASHF